jgi:hypothetical protein
MTSRRPLVRCGGPITCTPGQLDPDIVRGDGCPGEWNNVPKAQQQNKGPLWYTNPLLVRTAQFVAKTFVFPESAGIIIPLKRSGYYMYHVFIVSYSYLSQDSLTINSIDASWCVYRGDEVGGFFFFEAGSGS